MLIKNCFSFSSPGVLKQPQKIFSKRGNYVGSVLLMKWTLTISWCLLRRISWKKSVQCNRAPLCINHTVISAWTLKKWTGGDLPLKKNALERPKSCFFFLPNYGECFIFFFLGFSTGHLKPEKFLCLKIGKQPIFSCNMLHWILLG